MDRTALGRHGEDIAARLLVAGGFDIVERNYRRAGGEIDLIARKDDLLVFCEVKTAATDRWGSGWEAVSAMKARRVRMTAGRWLSERKPGRARIRFDIVSIVWDDRGSNVRHLIDAF